MKALLTVLVSPIILCSTSAHADFTYVTGNMQLHDGFLHGSSATSTLEAGHTFENTLGGLTILTEFDAIQTGEIKTAEEGASLSLASSPYITLGMEQHININDNFWVAVGYHHLLHDGKALQYRPLAKIGYNFDSGISISNRTRARIDASDSDNKTGYRLDNRVSYTGKESQFSFSYNNVFFTHSDTMDHELRMTWTRSGFQPYFEFRNQADDSNNAIVLGASYGF